MKLFKKLLFATAIFCTLTTSAYATEEVCLIKDADNVCYSDMQTALDTTTTTTLTLQDHINLNLSTNGEYVFINKDMTIDLNGYNIVSDVNTSFKVTKGTVKFTGTGTMTSSVKTHSVIAVTGSTDKEAKNYTNVTVDKNVTLEGGYGLFVTFPSTTELYAYGVTIDFYGKTNCAYGGLYMNGSIQHTENYPVFNVHDGAYLGGGIYFAGYAELNLGKATLESEKVTLGVKSGKVTIDGTTIINKAPVDTENQEKVNTASGINSSTAAIQIASNSGYAGGIEMTIKDGTFSSQNGAVFAEYIEVGDKTKVTNLSILGGTFTSGGSDNTSFTTSDDFATNIKEFISGGTYNYPVTSSFIKSGYIANQTETAYVVEEVKKSVTTEEIDTTKKVDEAVVGVTDATQITDTLVESIEQTYGSETENINATIDVQIQNGITATEEEKTAIETVLKKENEDIVISNYFDITLVVKNSDTSEKIGELTELTKEIELTIMLPEELQKVDKGYERNFYVVRIHNGQAEIIEDVTLSKDGTHVTFKTDKFSIYAVAYNDTMVPMNNETVPDTYDGIGQSFQLGMLSFLGLIGISVYVTKKELMN